MYVCMCVCVCVRCYCVMYVPYIATRMMINDKYLLTTVIQGLKNNTALYRYMVYYGFRASAVLVLL